MNDYKKLIKRLRYGDYMMNSDPFTLNTKMIEWSAKAADAIEQLVKDGLPIQFDINPLEEHESCWEMDDIKEDN